jgi:hypothetical protein
MHNINTNILMFRTCFKLFKIRQLHNCHFCYGIDFEYFVFSIFGQAAFMVPSSLSNSRAIFL